MYYKILKQKYEILENIVKIHGSKKVIRVENILQSSNEMLSIPYECF